MGVADDMGESVLRTDLADLMVDGVYPTASNDALEQTAGSHSLAAAAHRGRYPYKGRRGMR